MIEPLRSQYLAALGIDSYAPRFILPGAKISESCEWLDVPSDIGDTSARSEETVAENSSPRATTDAKAANEIVQRVPLIETATKRVARPDESSGAKAPAAQSQTGPQFALSIVLAGGGILLIDDAPPSSVDRTAFQKLLSNMLPALRPAAAQYALDIFIWPLTRQSKIPRDADAAIETLAAYLNKQIHQKSVNTVLLLGETAQHWCTFADTQVCVVKSSSLLACVRNPALKRPLWDDIRHLTER